MCAVDITNHGVTAMAITIHATFLPHTDPDASLAFYRDTLGFEVRTTSATRGCAGSPSDLPTSPVSTLS